MTYDGNQTVVATQNKYQQIGEKIETFDEISVVVIEKVSNVLAGFDWHAIAGEKVEMACALEFFCRCSKRFQRGFNQAPLPPATTNAALWERNVIV